MLKIEVPQEPRRLRDEVQSDVNVMFLLLGGLSLVVGAIGIANITLVSVMERTGEIGLRRAIGATRGHIAAQFLFESASMGIIGGILGASLGVIIVVAVSAYQVWTPVLDPAAPFLAPLIGGAIGLLSGIYPAMRRVFGTGRSVPKLTPTWPRLSETPFRLRESAAADSATWNARPQI